MFNKTLRGCSDALSIGMLLKKITMVAVTIQKKGTLSMYPMGRARLKQTSDSVSPGTIGIIQISLWIPHMYSYTCMYMLLRFALIIYNKPSAGSEQIFFIQ